METCLGPCWQQITTTYNEHPRWTTNCFASIGTYSNPYIIPLLLNIFTFLLLHIEYQLRLSNFELTNVAHTGEIWVVWYKYFREKIIVLYM